MTGNKPIPGRGASKKSHFRQGSFADGKQQGQGRQQKIPFQAGVVCGGQGPDRQQARSWPVRKQKIPFQEGLDRQQAHSWHGRQQKILFQAGVVCRWQGPDRQQAHSRQGHKQVSHFRQESFADGKGLTTPIQVPTCKEQILMCHKKKRYETCPKRRTLRNWSRSRRCRILCRSLTETGRFEQLVAGGTPWARPPQEEMLLKMHQAQTGTNAQGANLYVPQEEMVQHVPKRAKKWENGAGPGAAKFFV